jgi:hypothetical protein
MIDNGVVIATANVIHSLGLIALGVSMIWKAWGSIWHWPAPALVAMAGPYLIPGLILLQLAVWRMTEEDGGAFGYEGSATMALRVVGAVVTIALLLRVLTDTLLTESDRARVRDP